MLLPVVGPAYVQIAVHSEGQCDPYAERLSRRYDWIDVDEEYFVVVVERVAQVYG